MFGIHVTAISFFPSPLSRSSAVSCSVRQRYSKSEFGKFLPQICDCLPFYQSLQIIKLLYALIRLGDFYGDREVSFYYLPCDNRLKLLSALCCPILCFLLVEGAAFFKYLTLTFQFHRLIHSHFNLSILQFYAIATLFTQTVGVVMKCLLGTIFMQFRYTREYKIIHKSSFSHSI